MYNEIKVKKILMDEFRSQRISHDLSLEEMAEILEITPRAYIDLENGRYMCKAKVLINFLLFLDNSEELIKELRNTTDNK